jgi:hypothetical protein
MESSSRLLDRTPLSFSDRSALLHAFHDPLVLEKLDNVFRQFASAHLPRAASEGRLEWLAARARARGEATQPAFHEEPKKNPTLIRRSRWGCVSRSSLPRRPACMGLIARDRVAPYRAWPAFARTHRAKSELARGRSSLRLLPLAFRRCTRGPPERPGLNCSIELSVS